MIMKYRPTRSTASIPYSLLAAGEWRRNVSTSISKFTSFTAGVCRISGGCRGQGLQNFGRGAHTSACEDDFLELGPPVQENGAKLKLATEKPEILLKVNPVLKAKPSQSSENMPSIWSSVLKNFQAPKTKLRDQNDTSLLSVKKNYGSKSDYNTTIEADRSKYCRDTVNYVSSKFRSRTDLVQALPVSGKVSSEHIRRSPDSLNSCGAEFVNSESSSRTLLTSGDTRESIHSPIRPQQPSELLTIGIKGIGLGTTLSRVHDICKSIGALEGLSMDGKNAVKAYYRVKSYSKLRKILGRLNNIVINSHHWSAAVLSDKQEDGDKSKLAVQMNNRVADLRSHFMMQKIWLNDLEFLHMEILHLQGLPTDAVYASEHTKD